ncbi:MAG: hypothetical protein QXQ94_03770 [Candidatus Bathyarchaeia archaeon]
MCKIVKSFKPISVEITTMKTSFVDKKFGITLILIFIIFVAAVGYFLLISQKRKSWAFCAYQPLGTRQCNITEIISDLMLIKGMGFDGVKIFYEDIVDSGIVEPLLNYTKMIGLKVIFATHATYWGHKYSTIDFPNETIINNYKRELGAICGNITAHQYDHVPFMAVLYPIPFNQKWEDINEKLNSTDYKEALIEIVDYIKSFGLKVSMDTEGNPNDFPVPYIPNADLYGIMPFSPQWNYMNTTYIELWAAYFKQTGKQVYMSEYGFRTWRSGDPCQWDFGMVSNETIKAKQVREFVEYCRKNFEFFTYVLLFDNNEGGWGLAEKDTRILRESGIAMLEALQN